MQNWNWCQENDHSHRLSTQLVVLSRETSPASVPGLFGEAAADPRARRVDTPVPRTKVSANSCPLDQLSSPREDSLPQLPPALPAPAHGRKGRVPLALATPAGGPP